jgi:4-hydroxyphenylpyruvate dioxygenase-like putative hemolysin
VTAQKLKAPRLLVEASAQYLLSRLHHHLISFFPIQPLCISCSRAVRQYIDHLRETLDYVLKIQDWWTFYRSIGWYAQCMIVRIQRLFEFINSSLLDILVRDITLLIEQHMTEQRKGFSHFFKE